MSKVGGLWDWLASSQSPYRGIRIWWLWAAFLSGFALAMWAEDLLLSYRDNQIQLSAPRVHFLTGKPLERLHNAAEVPFDFVVTLFSGSRNHLLRRTGARFAVSYDLWEEKFSVTRLTGTRKSVAHLTKEAAEVWCMDQLPLDAAGLRDTEPFWVHLEIRAQNAKNSTNLFGRENLSESGISLNGLVEIFSRPAQTDQPHWNLDAGPMTLNEVRRGRG